jgi:hypothetical protein
MCCFVVVRAPARYVGSSADALSGSHSTACLGRNAETAA